MSWSAPQTRMSFSTFLTQIASVVQNEDGPSLAYYLRPTSPHGKDLIKEQRGASRQNLSHYKGSIDEPWDEIVIQYVLVTEHIAKKRSGEAFKEQSQLISLFFRYFTSNSGWTLPALFSILRDLRDLAFDADLHARYNNQKSECMEEAARIIAKAFSNCLTDRTSPYALSRKWGVYYVVGLVLKCYFRVKRISLSKNILRALEANEIPPLAEYPKSHQVTYRYYLGMIGFLNEDFAKAEKELTLAFYHCYIGASRNQERILTFLIPLRILRGHLPSRDLMERFPMLDELYEPFITAIHNGDIPAYDEALSKWERRLVELNLFLTVQKAREICMRTLFRRVWVATQKSTRIPISMFHSSLQLSGMTIDSEEAECLVANMIYKGYMRGYISHGMQTVVLAAGGNAFPRVADIPSPFALM